MTSSSIKKTKLEKVCSMPCCENDAVAVITKEEDVFCKKIFICEEHIKQIAKFLKGSEKS